MISLPLFMNLALATQPNICTSCLPWQQQNITVLGHTHNAAGRLAGWSDAKELNYGIQDLHISDFRFKVEDWPMVEADVESLLGVSIPGDMLSLWITTTETYPDLDVTGGDILGIEIASVSSGVLYHHFYQKTGTSFTLVPEFSRMLTGDMPCSVTFMMGAESHGGVYPDESVIYSLKPHQMASMLPTITSMDYDLEKDILIHNSVPGGTRSTSAAIFIGETQEPGSTSDLPVGPSGGQYDCHSVWNCNDDPNVKPRCATFTASCEDAVGPPVCKTQQGYSLGTITFDLEKDSLLYSVRDYLEAHTQLQHYVAAYYAFGYVSTTPLSASDFNELFSAADRFMAGSNSTIIVTATLHTAMSTHITNAMGIESTFDPALSAFQAELDYTQGMTRSQFCQYLLSDSTCDLTSL